MCACVRVCLCMWLWARWSRCPRGPEEDIKSPGTGAPGGCWMCVLGTRLRSTGRAAASESLSHLYSSSLLHSKPSLHPSYPVQCVLTVVKLCGLKTKTRQKGTSSAQIQSFLIFICGGVCLYREQRESHVWGPLLLFGALGIKPRLLRLSANTFTTEPSYQSL